MMNEELTAKLLAIEDRPAAPGDLIAFVRSLEGEFDRQQAESSVTFGLQRQVGGFAQVEIVEVPQFRLDDAPRSEKYVLRSSTCRHSVHAHYRRSIMQSPCGMMAADLDLPI